MNNIFTSLSRKKIFVLKCSVAILLASMNFASAQTFTAGNLVVDRIGDGSVVTSGAASPVFIDQYLTSTASQAAPVSSYAFPAVVTRPTAAPFNLLDAISATSNGNMSRSSDKRFLCVPGYNAIPGEASIANSSGATVSRTVGMVSASGVVSTPTALNMFTSNNYRSLTSDGTRFWAAGATGVNYIASSTASASTSISTINSRAINIFNGNLYYSTGSTTAGIYQLGTGLPTTTATGTLIAASASPYGFSFNAASTVLYVADDGAGIKKYTFNGTTWTLAYVLNTSNCRSLCVDYSSANASTGVGAVIYATTSTAATANTIIKITDGGVAGATATILATAGANKIFRGIDFAPVNLASIAIAPAHPAAGTINQGSADNIIGSVSMAVTAASSQLNGLTFNTAGTYQLSDITNFKFWINTSNSLSGATPLGSALTPVASGSSLSVTGLSNSLSVGSTYYILVTVSVNGSATPGNTVSLSSTAFSNISVTTGTTKTGTDPVSASNTQTIISLVPNIDISSATPAAGSLPQSSDNNIIHSISLNVSIVNATLTGLTLNTAGTYIINDLKANGFKLWMNSTNSLAGAVQLGSAQPVIGPGGTIGFTGLSATIPTGITYLFLTADVSYNAGSSRFISITSTAFSAITFASGTKTGTDPVSAGNNQTFSTVTPAITLTQLGPAANSLYYPVSKSVLYQFSAAVTVNSTDLNGISLTTNGTYQAADIVANSFKLWYNTSNSLTTAVQIGTAQPVSGTGLAVSFTGLAQKILSGATGYFWFTADIASSATAFRTIGIDSVAFSNIMFSAGSLSGLNPLAAGGVQTLKPTPFMTEVIFPQYAINGNTAGSRLQYVCRMMISNLTPNATYRYITNAGGAGNEFFINNTSTSPGGFITGYTASKSLAGTLISNNEFASASRYGIFTTNGAGTYTGWFSMVPTGNAVFNAGSTVSFTVQLNDGGAGTAVASTLNSTNTIMMINPSTGTSGGRAIRGSSSAAAEQIILIYDDTSGTTRPLYGTFTENDSITTNFSTWYTTSVDGVNGAWGAYIPSALPNGVRRIEQRDITTGAVSGCPALSANGVWSGAGNTVNPTGGTTPIVFTNSDAPLTCPILNTITTGNITPTTYCVDGFNTTAVSVPFTSTFTFNGTNVYTAQLSSSGGSFASPVNIGTLNSTANSGTITAHIPAGTAAGTQYRIRVISSSPAITGSNNGSNITLTPGTNFYADLDGDTYGDPFNAIVACSALAGYVTNNTDCDDFDFNVNPGVAEVCNNNIDDNCNGLIDENCTLTLNIKVFLQGYYQGTGIMNPALFNQGASTSMNDVDSLFLELRNTVSPFAAVYAGVSVLHTNGTTSFTLPPALTGSSYYIRIYTRNHLETWSKNPVLLSAITNFDFTVTAP